MIFLNHLAGIQGFHSISFPNEWGDGNELCSETPDEGFHSISFPNEWGGPRRFVTRNVASAVSIQLVSPTSGESSSLSLSHQAAMKVSIQLVSPTSGENNDKK